MIKFEKLSDICYVSKYHAIGQLYNNKYMWALIDKTGNIVFNGSFDQCKAEANKIHKDKENNV